MYDTSEPLLNPAAGDGLGGSSVAVDTVDRGTLELSVPLTDEQGIRREHPSLYFRTHRSIPTNYIPSDAGMLNMVSMWSHLKTLAA